MKSASFNDSYMFMNRRLMIRKSKDFFKKFATKIAVKNRIIKIAVINRKRTVF